MNRLFYSGAIKFGAYTFPTRAMIFDTETNKHRDVFVSMYLLPLSSPNTILRLVLRVSNSIFITL